LQYGIVPRLPATARIVNHLTDDSSPNDRLAELEKLQKHRSESAQLYRKSLEKLAANRDQYLKETTIGRGDLVMRKRINVESKLHPRWDGPFVIVSSTPEGTYHLATANGRMQANQAQLRRLSHSETRRYVNDFWHTSARTRKLDQQVLRAEQDCQITATMLQHRAERAR